jgi:two-component system chemotaxis response regulator CheY
MTALRRSAAPQPRSQISISRLLRARIAQVQELYRITTAYGGVSGVSIDGELTRCSMSPDSCHRADGCAFEKRPSRFFSRAMRIHLCSAVCCLRGVEDMAFDLSMPILVVDDYSTMIRIIRNLLKQLGFENVDDASDGSAALAKMQTKRYGLVISDWNMEPMTGYDLLKEVRASPEFSKTPFIMITAESKTENVIAAKKAGVNNYIVKPFNAATLKTKMEAVFPGSAD